MHVCTSTSPRALVYYSPISTLNVTPLAIDARADKRLRIKSPHQCLAPVSFNFSP